MNSAAPSLCSANPLSPLCWTNTACRQHWKKMAYRPQLRDWGAKSDQCWLWPHGVTGSPPQQNLTKPSRSLPKRPSGTTVAPRRMVRLPGIEYGVDGVFPVDGSSQMLGVLARRKDQMRGGYPFCHRAGADLPSALIRSAAGLEHIPSLLTYDLNVTTAHREEFTVLCAGIRN